MALYAIADLHLPLGVDKPMDIFGKSWENYVFRLENNWQRTVSPEDVVILPGDFSWATYINDAYKDFEYLNRLNGKKYIIKGNHDYWWTTMNKMRNFIADNSFKNIDFLQNNAIVYKDTAICGTRGWKNPLSDDFSDEDKRIFEREVIRLGLALDEADRLEIKERIVFTHYPPTGSGGEQNEFTQMMEERGVRKCVYGHLHAASHKKAVQGLFRGIEYILVSSDYLGFLPGKILD